MEKNLVYVGKRLIACSNALYSLFFTQILAGVVSSFIELTDMNQVSIFIFVFGIINLFIIFYLALELNTAGIALSNTNNKNTDIN